MATTIGDLLVGSEEILRPYLGKVSLVDVSLLGLKGLRRAYFDNHYANNVVRPLLVHKLDIALDTLIRRALLTYVGSVQMKCQQDFCTEDGEARPRATDYACLMWVCRDCKGCHRRTTCSQCELDVCTCSLADGDKLICDGCISRMEVCRQFSWVEVTDWK